MSIVGSPICIGQSGISLPNGYQLVAYVSGSVENGPNLNLGYTPTSASKIWLEYFSLTESSPTNYGWVLGSHSFRMSRNGTTNDLHIVAYDSHFRTVTDGLTTGLRTAFVDLGNKTWGGSGLGGAITVDEDPDPSEMVTWVRSSVSVCQIKAWDSGILSRHYVACYRKSDNTPGLYELKTGVFYENIGSGTLVAGPDIK